MRRAEYYIWLYLWTVIGFGLLFAVSLHVRI